MWLLLVKAWRFKKSYATLYRLNNGSMQQYKLANMLINSDFFSGDFDSYLPHEFWLGSINLSGPFVISGWYELSIVRKVKTIK